MRTLLRLSVLAPCLLAAVTAIACGDRPSPTEPSAANDSVRQITDQSPVREARAAIREEIVAARRATAAFHDPAVAAAAGYTFGEPCQANDTGAMGIHVPNPALVRDGVINLEQPEILLYLPNEDGSLRLVGVEYMQVVTVRNPSTGVSAPWRSPVPWPSNYEVVTSTPRLFEQTFAGPMAGHTTTMPWHWDLHVWLWAHNPDGMFAPYNPALQCGAS